MLPLIAGLLPHSLLDFLDLSSAMKSMPCIEFLLFHTQSGVCFSDWFLADTHKPTKKGRPMAAEYQQCNCTYVSFINM